MKSESECEEGGHRRESRIPNVFSIELNRSKPPDRAHEKIV